MGTTASSAVTAATGASCQQEIVRAGILDLITCKRLHSGASASRSNQPLMRYPGLNNFVNDLPEVDDSCS